ncbi:uncharacterized protein LOC131424380 [Marmota monax]|uniref:uncharacterized protein LOC131424380 n=1 Tax=Marmota monax TaxID=9995 RepID=UPI0026F17537|nr:uncharacterized protein LOC131424380 [Marmota monax]
MGQSLTTPLSLTLDHWQDVQDRADNLSVTVKKKKWKTLCTSEWPTFNTSWPAEGTFNTDLIFQVKTRIFTHGPHGHPDQIPYIVTWEDLASNPPPWVAPFSPPKPPLRSPLEPSAPLIPLPPPQTSHLYPVLNKSETSVKTGTTPKKVLPPEDSALIDLLTDEPPPYQPQPLQAPEPDQASSEDENQEGPVANAPPDPSPMVGRLRGCRDHTASGDTSRVLPLRQTGGPNGQYQYWPFTASDLYNRKTHNPSFSKDPIALTSLIESILVTHQPTWDDCQQLLQILLTSEEKQKVLLEARKNVPGDDGRPTQLPNLINEAFPLTRPNWDHATEAGRDHLRLYRQLLIAGLHAAGRRPTNLAQVRQTTQGAEETPTAFLERLKEAYRRFTPFDPDSEDQKGNVSMAFIWHSAPDIRSKLQRLDNLQDFSLADLLKEAEKIYNKRETPEEREDRIRKTQEERELKLREESDKKERERERRRNRELSKILATVVQAGHQGNRVNRDREQSRPRVDRDQCAHCKEKGHWVKDCPKRPPNPRRDTNRAPRLLTLDED